MIKKTSSDSNIDEEKILKLNPENSHAAKEIDAIKYPTIDKSKFSKIYSKQQYLEDIDEFANRLTTVNPNAYKYISKEEFWLKVAEKKKIITSKKTPAILGEELGSNEFSTGGQNVFRTKNTEVFYAIGRYTYITATDSVIDTHGIMPDYFVTQSIEDYINNVDTVLQHTLNLISGDTTQ